MRKSRAAAVDSKLGNFFYDSRIAHGAPMGLDEARSMRGQASQSAKEAKDYLNKAKSSFRESNALKNEASNLAKKSAENSSLASKLGKTGRLKLGGALGLGAAAIGGGLYLANRKKD